MRAVLPTLAVQAAVVALVIGRPSVPLACAAGVAALALLLAFHTRGRPGGGIVVGAALATMAALLAGLVPAGPGWLAGVAPVAALALYLVASPISLPRRQSRGSAREPR